MRVLLIGLLLAGAFFGLHTMLRKRGDERTYNLATVVVAGSIIVIAFGLFAATQLGFISNHAP